MSQAEHTKEAYRLVQEIWIDAPRERVFRALIEPAEVCAWWGVPGAYQTTDAEIDLRVGGRYLFSGSSEQAATFEVGGEFRLIEPPHRLAYTWNPAWDDGAEGSLVTFTLEERDGGTHLVVEHTAFRSERTRDDHLAGWPPVLASLKAHAEGAA